MASQSIIGFHFATGLDLKMGYLSMPLDEPSKVTCMIFMLFVLFECQVLPQGVKSATDIFQGCTTSLFSHLKSKAPKIYLDNVPHTSGNSFGDHLKHLETILENLKNAGMQVNAKKCTWCATLSFWVIHDGYQLPKSQVKATIVISPLTNVKQVCIFIRCINFIKNHIPKWTEILEPITNLTKKGEKFGWGSKQWEAF